MLDGMVEFGFADEADQKRFEEASPLLFADERNLGVTTSPMRSRTDPGHWSTAIPTLFRTGARAGTICMCTSTATEPVFREAVTALAETLAAEGAVLKVRLHCPETYDNADPAPGAPDVGHQLPERRHGVALLEVAWERRLAAERWLAGEAYAPHADALRRTAGALGACLVEGVYTCIRDGKLTGSSLVAVKGETTR